MATRTHAREMVVELLYAYAMGNERIFDFADELLNAKKIRNAQADFAKGLFEGVVAHLQNIDSIIEANLKSWELSRLGVIDKCILRLGVYEILKGEIDAPVAINEAIEIAKILGAENTGKFVNGVLDAIRKGGFDLEKGVESHKNSSLGAGNSSLGASCVDFGNLGRFADLSPVSHPKFPKNSTTSTANTRIYNSKNAESNKKSTQRTKKPTNRTHISSLRDSAQSAESWQSKSRVSNKKTKYTKLQNSRRDSKGGLLRAKRTRNDNIKSQKSAQKGNKK